MASIWELIVKVFKHSDTQAADQASERLKMVLVQDRIKITPDAMEEMKTDLIKTLSEYLEVNKDELELKVTRDGAQTSLIANIPIQGGRAEVVGKRKEVPPKAHFEEGEEGLIGKTLTDPTPVKTPKKRKTRKGKKARKATTTTKRKAKTTPPASTAPAVSTPTV